jgi:hypothetical protein
MLAAATGEQRGFPIVDEYVDKFSGGRPAGPGWIV